MDAPELAIVLLSAALHAVWGVAIKGSRDGLLFNAIQTIAASAVGVGLLLTLDWETVPSALWPIAAATGIPHALYLYWLCRGLAEADISLVYPIARSTPAFLPLLAVPLLGERVSWGGVAGIATVVGGMWLVAAGRSLRLAALRGPGLVFAYLTLAAGVGYGLLDKAAMTQLEAARWTHPVPRPIFFFFMTYLFCAPVLLPLCLRDRRASEFLDLARREWRSAGLALGLGMVGYGLILEAFRTAPASYVVAVRQSSVLFVVLLGAVRLGERPEPARVFGAVLTVCGVAAIALAP